ncbi:hypothetical protein RFM23_11250 [Mesorhizobium abyssinicae]|uniref:Uncharacterized protein n=1 Tax=Mesorhizobium abyssinicae TaxID=1209958 RepID=A0ABU5ALN1_9HYPH|nr:hypothetical protein [Mesorhizobium abyssinicae]MDX8538195.1 hypothetical protein [Mesorhizobium abyssinicae]
METRPFYRVYHMTKQEAAVQQIEAAIAAFHSGQFAVSITLTGAAEDMAPAKPGGLWERILSNRPPEERKEWVSRLNETFYWLKHERPNGGQTRNLVAFEAGLFILRAMDKWDEQWTPAMVAFKDLWFSSPKLMRPEDYSPE